jgi:hypothetical protein
MSCGFRLHAAGKVLVSDHAADCEHRGSGVENAHANQPFVEALSINNARSLGLSAREVVKRRLKRSEMFVN